MGIEQLINEIEASVLPSSFINRFLKLNRHENISLDHENIVNQLRNAAESREVRQMYLGDINSIFGRAMNKVLDWRGYQKRMPDHYAYLDLPEQVMAATITTNDGKVILAYNRKHAEKIRNNKLLRIYVNLHEHGHVRGEPSESFTEGLVGDAAYLVRKSLQPLYRWSKKAQEVVQNAINIERYAAARQSVQYGR
jgi:hypothetical protein